MPEIQQFERLDVPVPGGNLAAYRLTPRAADDDIVIAAHGITSSSRTWLAVARALRSRTEVLAVDLRGRGASSRLPPPFGIAEHAADLLALLDWLELERAVLLGHSLGAYIAARFAVDHPDRVRSLVMVDGGLPIPGSEHVDPQVFAEALLGPALARLKLTFPTPEAYRDWWRAHPAIAAGDVQDEDLVAYADYDLTGTEPELHSVISEQAVRADADDLPRSAGVTHQLTVPATLLCAERGLRDDPNPMQPIELAQGWAAQAPAQRQARLIKDVNHYTIAWGSRGAAAVAEVVADAVKP